MYNKRHVKHARGGRTRCNTAVSAVRSTVSGTIKTPTLVPLGIAGLQPPLRPSRHQYLHSGKNRRTSLWRKVFRLGERPEESEGPQTMRWFLALPFSRLASLRWCSSTIYVRVRMFMCTSVETTAKPRLQQCAHACCIQPQENRGRQAKETAASLRK